MNAEPTDNELIEGCLGGDPVSQRKLFDKFAPAMMSVALRYSDSAEEAQDVLQDGFIKVFEKLGQYSGKGSLGGWIRAVVVNTALIQIRKNKRKGFSESIDEAHELSSDDFGVLESMAADELLKLIADMPTGYRTVFNLFAIEGYGHKEIADMLEISESTSKTQFLKAKAFLRKQIDELGLH